jgi:hypothetical protein
MAIVTILERGNGGAHLFDVLEDTAMNGLLLQRPVEALGHAVGLGSATKAKLLSIPRNSICLRLSENLAVGLAPT